MAKSEGEQVRIAQAKGRPMLSWVGKRPLREVRAFRHSSWSASASMRPTVRWPTWTGRAGRRGSSGAGSCSTPTTRRSSRTLLANGFRGKVDLVYIDPPFDSGADYPDPGHRRKPPIQRPREKGIDLVMALDVLEFAITDRYACAIVVSLDRDLHEIPQAQRNMRGVLRRPFRIEAAMPVLDGLTRPKTLTGFDFTHQITRVVWERIRDDTDYTVADEGWAPPIPPNGFREPA